MIAQLALLSVFLAPVLYAHWLDVEVPLALAVTSTEIAL